MIQKNRAPKKTMHKRGVQRFSVDNFSLTVPKNFVGKRFCVSEISSTEKNYGEEGSVTFFRRKLFVQNRRKTSSANPSMFQKCSGIRSF